MEFIWNNEQRSLNNHYKNIGYQISKKRLGTYDFDYDGWETLAQAGFWKIAVPKKLGGSGKDWWDFVASFEGLAQTCGDLGFLLSIIAHIGSVRILLNQANQKQLSKFLPGLLSGKIGATAITEETGGSDVARIQLKALRKSDGYFLNGKKAHITNAPISDFAIIAGRIPEYGKNRDITLFLIGTHDIGITREKPEKMSGNQSSPTGNLILNNVRIHKDNILTQPGDGLKTLYDMISLDRLLYGIMAAAISENILGQAMLQCNSRQAFKQSLTNFQYIQGKLVDIKINIEKSRWLSYAALDKLIHQDKEASIFCSMAKLIGTESLCESAQHLMILHGHEGYMAGEISKLVQDVLGTRIAGGTSDIQRVNIFNQMQNDYLSKLNLRRAA